MDSILNIAAYKFVSLDDREALRETLLARAGEGGLRGTILLAPEGINLFLAGAAEAVRAFLTLLRADPRFADLEAKESWSAARNFSLRPNRFSRISARRWRPLGLRPSGSSS